MKEKILNYLRETAVEMRKVIWPDQRYIFVATLIVLVLVGLTMVFVMLVDFGLARIFGAFIK